MGKLAQAFFNHVLFPWQFFLQAHEKKVSLEIMFAVKFVTESSTFNRTSVKRPKIPLETTHALLSRLQQHLELFEKIWFVDDTSLSP